MRICWFRVMDTVLQIYMYTYVYMYIYVYNIHVCVCRRKSERSAVVRKFCDYFNVISENRKQSHEVVAKDDKVGLGSFEGRRKSYEIISSELGENGLGNVLEL